MVQSISDSITLGKGPLIDRADGQRTLPSVESGGLERRHNAHTSMYTRYTDVHKVHTSTQESRCPDECRTRSAPRPVPNRRT